jgi:hypothetical protein
MDDETLPDSHTRTVSLTLNVAEFRELMRAAAYREADLGSDPVAATLGGAWRKLGDAWEAAQSVEAGADPARSVLELALRTALKDGDEQAVVSLRARLEEYRHTP